jgi:lipid II:glycine glycyltransferase (peptidoglycan interpeptide bridge formation enzyme)
VFLDGTPPEDWDAFVASVPQGHPEQLHGWAAAEHLGGWDASWIVIRSGGAVVAGSQVLHRPVRRLGRTAYVRGGPVFGDGSRELRAALTDALNRWAALNKVRYLVVNAARSDAECEAQLRRVGFAPKPARLAPRVLAKATLFIDLQDSPEKILSKMRREKRRKIRDARKSALTFREGGRADLPAFFDLLKITAAKRGCAPRPSSLAYLETLWDRLSAPHHMRLFMVELAGDPVCAGVVLPVADTVRFWRYGWNGEHAKLAPSAWLYWKLIEWSRAHGYRYVDIVQVDSELAAKIAGKSPLTAADRAHRLYGPTLFKTGFGGEVVRLPGPLCRFYPAWVNGLFHAMFSR